MGRSYHTDTVFYVTVTKKHFAGLGERDDLATWLRSNLAVPHVCVLRGKSVQDYKRLFLAVELMAKRKKQDDPTIELSEEHAEDYDAIRTLDSAEWDIYGSNEDGYDGTAKFTNRDPKVWEAALRQGREAEDEQQWLDNAIIILELTSAWIRGHDIMTRERDMTLLANAGIVPEVVGHCVDMYILC
ncbi:hypothetical protein [Mollivirus kamchatka]|nr:hypothetical protein [Mollivirus kamchatka]